MQEGDEFIILIYHNGCEIGMPVHGNDRYSREKSFLNELIGWYDSEPGTSLEIYPLDDQQFDAYLDFRKMLRESP